MAKLKTSRYDKIRNRLLQNSKVIFVTMKKLKSRQNYMATKLKNSHCDKLKDLTSVQTKNFTSYQTQEPKF